MMSLRISDRKNEKEKSAEKLTMTKSPTNGNSYSANRF